MTEPYRLSATEALAKLRDGSLTVEAYARSLLSRIAETDENIQAWAWLDPEAVLKEAVKLDAIPRDKRGPLHGIPIGVKDVFQTKDWPTQYNSPTYEGHTPQVDAACVRTLRASGALIFGKTTTTQFAAIVKGPKTRNPHDSSRTPGGSSSGSGAGVAACHVPLALGTQTGGSIVRPGSYNGVLAFKPSWNSIAREGAKIYSLLFDTMGVYARSVDDFDLFMDVFHLRSDEPVLRPVKIEGAKFAVIKTMQWSHAGPGTQRALQTAADLLRQSGAEVEDVELPPEFDQLPHWHRIWLESEGRTSFLPEYYAAKDALDPYLIGQVDNKSKITRKDQLAAFDGMALLRPKIDELARPFTAIVTPSAADEASVGIENTGKAAFNLIWTALHTPVINLPGFCGEHGMPIGISIVGPRYGDEQLLEVAKVVGPIFAAKGGWKSSL